MSNASPETVSYIQGYKSDYQGVGYQRVAGVAKRKGLSATEWNVRKVFGEYNLFNHRKLPKNPNEHNNLFVARYAGQIWHADIHYIRIDSYQFYLLGFIDDRTRFLVHNEVLVSKDSKTCSEALMRALGKVQHRPKMLTIDNGGEFVGNPFQSVLNANGIEEFRSHLYTPQQNGKIERFWATIERARGAGFNWNLKNLQETINEYNSYWNHRSLKKLTGQDMTPLEAWNTMTKYVGQDDAIIESI